MSSPQPASAASAAAEASAGDPRFAQLLLGAYQWLETNGSSLLADMDYLAQNTRPGGQQPTDKYIALLDVKCDDAADHRRATGWGIDRSTHSSVSSLSLASAAYVWHTARRAMPQSIP